MGHKYDCDLCHKILPNADALQALKFGDQQIAELCLTCNSAIKTGIQRKLAEADAAFAAAVQQPTPTLGSGDPGPEPPQAPPEVPPQAEQQPGGD